MRTSLPSSALSALGLAALSLAAIPANAGPIEYLFTGTVSGSLGGKAFQGAQITFTAFGDTTTVVPGSVFRNLVGSPTFTLTGFGSGTLTQTYNIFDNQNTNAVGLQPLTANDLFDEKAADYETYGLATSLGPISSDGDAFGNIGNIFGTSLGDLSFSAFGPATFQATTNAVPEASTTASFGFLFALGLGGIVVAAKRKKRVA